MATYYIDFSGYCEIAAESEEEAIKHFWEKIVLKEALPKVVYEVEGIEEKS